MGKDGKPEKVSATDNLDLTACRWAVTPEIMYWGARFIAERYQKPIYVTENGMSGVDWVSQNDGQVHDPQRIEFLTRYLRSLRRATEFADLRGYFQWSIMDNFEWEQGYKERFGLIYVDYNTQKRVPKDSAYWYKDIIASNGECLA